MRNRRIVLAARPREGRVTADLFRPEEGERPTPAEGQALLRVIYLSLDPAMRGWIAEAPNYSPPVPIGAVMRSFAVAEVVESRHPDLTPGDYLYGRFGWQEWALTDGSDIDRVITETDLPLSYSAHVLGLTGLTAYLGLTVVGQPKAGETVAVSTAAGAVGSIVGQVAKILGCRTVGLTGSDEKVAACLGPFRYDAAINYKTADLEQALATACPTGVDVYFDNVGGTVSDAVMARLNNHARVVVCGTMGIPSAPPPLGPRYNRILLTRRAKMEGFIYFDHAAAIEPAAAQLAAWLREGRLTAHEDVAEGLEATVPHLLRLLAGHNSGKALVRITHAGTRGGLDCPPRGKPP